MPSPFPGMDPYLEHPEFFPDLHGILIAYLRETIQPLLPPPYYAIGGSRSWIEYSKRPIEPDLSVLRTDAPSSSTAVGIAPAGVAVTPFVVYVANDETNEPFLEIRTTRGNRQLITVIEILSPSNKTPGEMGQQLYLQKQREITKSQVNLVEIDLLRGGVHTTFVPLETALAATGSFDYHICVRKMDELQQLLVYPVLLQQSLPKISIPLLPGDPEVVVDLQAVFDRCYDTGPYRQANPYRQLPVPPLTAEQKAWADDILRAKGIIPPG